MIDGEIFEGQEIPFNLHQPIRDLLQQRDELLAVLKDLVEALPPKGDRNQRYAGQCAKADAAIAKAEGHNQ